MARRSVDNLTLERWRGLPAAMTAMALCNYCKEDLSFEPVEAIGTKRWHVRVGEREFELLLNGPKFFDTQTGQGGGGAIDLAMYLLNADFRAATSALTAASL